MSASKPFTIDVRPVRAEEVTPSEFLRLTKENPRLIDRAGFIPPSLGTSDFGTFLVRYTRAIHKRPAHG